MISETIRLPVDGGASVAAVVTRPEVCDPGVTPGVVLAHGANNDLHHPLLEAVATGLAEVDTATTLRFNFPYRERGVSSPDRQEVLEDTYRRAHDALVDERACPPGPLFLAGKSLGARVAAGLISRHHEGEGLLASGLVLLGYPLHAPGRHDKLRLEPLRRLDVPSLFVQGSRDPFCNLDLLVDALEGIEPTPVLYVVENGGHSYEVPKADGRSEEEVHREVVEQVAAFIRQVAGS